MPTPFEVERFLNELNAALHGAEKHAHRCGACGHRFIHGESCAGSEREHLCPECGTGPWWVRDSVRGPRR